MDRLAEMEEYNRAFQGALTEEDFLAAGYTPEEIASYSRSVTSGITPQDTTFLEDRFGTLQPADAKYRAPKGGYASLYQDSFLARNKTEPASVGFARDYMGFVPILGDVLGVGEVSQELQKEEPNYPLAAALGAATLVGAVPAVGDPIAKAMKETAIKIANSPTTADFIGSLRALGDLDYDFLTSYRSPTTAQAVGADVTRPPVTFDDVERAMAEAAPNGAAVKPQMGEAFDDWIDRIYAPENRGPQNVVQDENVVFRAMSPQEAEVGEKAGVFRDLFGQPLYVANDPERYIGGGAYGGKQQGRIYEFDVTGLPSEIRRGGVGIEERAISEIPADRVRRVWEWNPDTQAHELIVDNTQARSVKAERPTTEAAPETIPAAPNIDNQIAELDVQVKELRQNVLDNPTDTAAFDEYKRVRQMRNDLKDQRATARAEARNVASSVEEPDISYRIDHQPTGPSGENPIRLDDLTKSTTGEQAGYPEDFYSSQGQRIYAPPARFADDEYGIANQESYEVIKSVRGNPDAEVTIYRGVPNDVNEINSGDWVTLSPKYAELHAASGYGPRGDEAGKVISQKVKVKDIYFGGDDVNEFGYFPSNKSTSAPMGLSETIEAKYPNVTVDLYGNPERGYELSRIVVPEGERGTGVGTQVMEDMIRMADEQGARISLTPDTSFGGSSVSRLKDFYKRFGFVENKGKNKDFSTRNTMYRDPQAPKEQFGGEAPPAIEETLQGIKAFHGSPYDFDRFDLSFMGAGEGAQEYGKGLYFAEMQDVAEGYRDEIFAPVDPSAFSTDEARDIANTTLQSFGARPNALKAAVTDLKNALRNEETTAKFFGGNEQRIADLNEAINYLENNVQSGRLYEVNINADQSKMLDFDKPMSEQPQEVQEVLEPYFQMRVQQMNGDPEVLRSKLQGGDIMMLEKTNREMAGEISKALSDAGISGVRYLDQKSRSKQFEIKLSRKGKPYETEQIIARNQREADRLAEEYKDKGFDVDVEDIRTRNFVVFDDSLIDIVKKHGFAGLMVGAAVQAGMSQDQDAEAI